MRYIIASATAFTLVVGIAIGFALTATVFEAEAQPPPPEPAGGPPSPEPAGGRTILVAENVVVGEGVTHTTSFIATPDCGALSVFTEGSGPSILTRRLLLSADGVVTNAILSGIDLTQGRGTNVTVFATSAGPILAPFVAVELGEPRGAGTVTVDKAWLFCAR